MLYLISLQIYDSWSGKRFNFTFPFHLRCILHNFITFLLIFHPSLLTTLFLNSHIHAILHKPSYASRITFNNWILFLYRFQFHFKIFTYLNKNYPQHSGLPEIFSPLRVRSKVPCGGTEAFCSLSTKTTSPLGHPAPWNVALLLKWAISEV